MFFTVPPKIHGPTFRNIEGIVNQTLQIECRTSGIPEPKIEWTKDARPLSLGSNMELLYNGTILRLYNIESTHEGRYSCTAMNKIGRAEIDAFIQVIGKFSLFSNSQLKIVRFLQFLYSKILCLQHRHRSQRIKWM